MSQGYSRALLGSSPGLGQRMSIVSTKAPF